MAQEQKLDLSPEEEIAELERKLEERKRELAGKGEAVPEEKEIFREALRRHIEEVRPPVIGGPPSPPPAWHKLPLDLQKKADDLRAKEKREEQVRALVEIALTRSIAEAIKVAEHATPFLLDELHDHLVDDYYDKLVQLRKLKEL